MPVKRKKITFSELKRLSLVGKTKGTYDMGGRKMRDVGIGFVDEGEADATDTLVTEDDGSVPKTKRRAP